MQEITIDLIYDCTGIYLESKRPLMEYAQQLVLDWRDGEYELEYRVNAQRKEREQLTHTQSNKHNDYRTEQK
jgi:hypothetical protein